MRVLVLNRRDVESMLPMHTCIELMDAALASLSRGEVILPLRPVLRVPSSPNVFALMPAYSQALKAIGTKLITVFPGNHGTAIDSHQGAVLLFDGETGSLLALMDAASITAIRTAAVSGVATRLLARRDSATLAILGAGVQAHTHIDAMLAVRPLTRILIWSRSGDHARAVARDAGTRHGVNVEVVEDAATAVRAADVVCTVTASREPVLRGEWLRPGAHVNAVGASIPTARELDTEAVTRARLFVDRRESALNEAGDVLLPIAEGAMTAGAIVAEIGELIAHAREGRRDGREITLFKSLGLAIEDLACAHYLHGAAKAAGAGTWVDL
jgi:ornithine cyclodeaminase/alanine dehydrogenase-like protein (mu-crystallin family)